MCYSRMLTQSIPGKQRKWEAFAYFWGTCAALPLYIDAVKGLLRRAMCVNLCTAMCRHVYR